MDNDDWFNSDNHASSKPQYSRNNDSNLQNPCKIYIANIPENLTKGGVKNMFQKFGRICKFFRSTESEKNYALVEYETELSAMDAICSLHRKPPLHLNITFGQCKNYDCNTEGKDLDTLMEILKRHKISFNPNDIKDNFGDDDDSWKVMENKRAYKSTHNANPRGQHQDSYQQDNDDDDEMTMENKQAFNSSCNAIPRGPRQNNYQQNNQKRNYDNNVNSYNGNINDVAGSSRRPHDDFDLDYRQDNFIANDRSRP